MGSEHPLGLPPGSVRALIAILVIFATLIGGLLAHFKGMETLPEQLWQAMLIVIAFYFGFRSNAGKIERIPEKEICEIAEQVVEEKVQDECLEE